MITLHTCDIFVLITSLDLLSRVILWILFFFFRLKLEFEHLMSKQMQIGNDLVRQLVKSSWIKFSREKNYISTQENCLAVLLMLFKWGFRGSAV